MNAFLFKTIRPIRQVRSLSMILPLLAVFVSFPLFGQDGVSNDLANPTFIADEAESTNEPNNKYEMDTLIMNFDALKKSNWSNQESQNAEMILDFVQHLMNNHDFDYILENFKDQPYLQHNRNIPDGIEGLIGYLSGVTKRYPEYSYDVKHIYVDGDYVSLHSHATMKKKDRGNDEKGFNIIDTWRVKDGVIVEHWDAVQPLDASMRLFVWMTGGKIRNGNGPF